MWGWPGCSICCVSCSGPSIPIYTEGLDALDFKGLPCSGFLCFSRVTHLLWGQPLPPAASPAQTPGWSSPLRSFSCTPWAWPRDWLWHESLWGDSRRSLGPRFCSPPALPPWQAQLVEDFRALRQAAEDMELFEAKPAFFALLLGHILAMEVLAWLLVYLFGPGWVPSTLAALVLATSQVTPALSCRHPSYLVDTGPGTRGHSGCIC